MENKNLKVGYCNLFRNTAYLLQCFDPHPCMPFKLQLQQFCREDYPNWFGHTCYTIAQFIQKTYKTL